MITLVNVSKRFGPNQMLNGVSHTFPSGAVTGVLGSNGAGKSTLLRLLAGTSLPDRGQILRHGSVSWPVGLTGGLRPDLTGAQNVRLAAKLYVHPSAQVFRRCEALAKLGPGLHQPVRCYSNGMRARLGFALSMALPFDTYLFDEITAVGDQRFRALCAETLALRLKGQSAIIVSHAMPVIRELCDHAVVLDGGHLSAYHHVDGAIAHYNRIMAMSA